IATHGLVSRARQRARRYPFRAEGERVRGEGLMKAGTGVQTRLWSTTFDRELRRVITSIRLGELDDALEIAAAVAVKAKEQRDEYALGRARMFLAEATLLRGDADGARE